MMNTTDSETLVDSVLAGRGADELSPQEVFDLYFAIQNKSEVARLLKKPRSWVRRRVDLVEGDEDHEPELVSPVDPKDLALTGHSDFEDGEGNLIRRWNKYNRDTEKRLERINAAFGSLIERLPVQEIIAPPKRSRDDLLNLYTFTDYHLGMYAHASMNGDEDWSTEKAKRYIVAAITQMLAIAPGAKKCILNIQGDFLHNDGLWPVTPTSRHVLDQDCRYEELADIAMDVIERLIILCLQYHEEVEVLIAEGNHDLSGTHILQAAFSRIFRDNDRVKVHREKKSYYAFEFGNTGIFVHHGHHFSIKKPDVAALKFAANYPEIWGRTKKRYGHFGHLHHEDVREPDGMILRQHPTLAPNDTHGTQGGYVSERAARYITYHRDSGEVLSGRVTPEMVSL